jgi:hypothetical protein
MQFLVQDRTDRCAADRLRVGAGCVDPIPVKSGKAVIRSLGAKRPAQIATGAIALVVAYGMCAPGSAHGGCNHLVNSRSDSARHETIDRLSRDLAGQPQNAPIAPRPCSGAFCTGQPGTPAVPASAFDGTVDSWAWCAWNPTVVLTPSSFLAIQPGTPEPTRRASGVFHPPRSAPPV